MPGLHLATFGVDVTPPVGHPLCGGWIEPAATVTDPLYVSGVVLLGGAAPVVLCAVDWTGICNDGHAAWRDKLARAAHTTPERVAVQCVHPHNAPFADPAAHKLVVEHNTGAGIVDPEFFARAIGRTAEAIEKALAETKAVTHIACGQARVEKVASNRRIIGPDGKVAGWRGSATKDAKLRDQPEGLIDPMLKTVSLWDGDRKLAALHWYATHPMSHYGDGAVSSDFVGMARDRRTKDDGVLHVHFNGCGGNVAAGKYNDGVLANLAVLADRMHAGLVDSEKAADRQAVTDFEWAAVAVELTPRADTDEEKLLAVIADGKAKTADRHRAAMKLSYRRRAGKVPIQVDALRIGKASLLNLPAECFVEYQLFAQLQNPDLFAAVAAYGDGGPWYLPTADAFAQGGYEVGVAFTEPTSAGVLQAAMVKLIKG